MTINLPRPPRGIDYPRDPCKWAVGVEDWARVAGGLIEDESRLGGSAGKTGPPGPPGPTGATGAQGPPGAGGVAGMVAGQIPIAAAANSIASSANLSGDVTSAPTTLLTTLASTGVVPGSYTSTNLTVDAKGRVTAAANGSSSNISGTTSGQVAIAGPSNTITSSRAYGVSGSSTIIESNASGWLSALVMPAYTGDVTSPGGSRSSIPWQARA